MGLGWTTATRNLVAAGTNAVIAVGSYTAGKYGAFSGAAITPRPRPFPGDCQRRVRQPRPISSVSEALLCPRST
jgi:hypothetical protein